MKKVTEYVFLLCAFILWSCVCQAQNTRDILIGAGFDIYKTDRLSSVFKIQAGGEVNYFIIRNFSATGGVEIWTGNDNNNSLTVGMRWYPVKNLFVRFRGFLGENDLAIGAGYGYPLNRQWRIEGIADYYLEKDDLAFRLGLGYLIRK